MLLYRIILKVYYFLLWYPNDDDVLKWKGDNFIDFSTSSGASSYTRIFYNIFFTGPPEILARFLSKIILLWPTSVIWNPRIPRTEGVLYVCNHSTWGIDMLLLFALIYRETGRIPRGLGDRAHFYFPISSQILRYFGCVEGTRDICASLMKNSSSILVFPGGAREVMRRTTDPPYTLFWEERTGFARLAIEHGYAIVPVAAVGTEENVGIIYDLPSINLLLIGDKRKHDLTIPLIYPKAMERFYFHFGEPITTIEYNGNCSTNTVVEVRDKTYEAVVDLLSKTLNVQSKDLNRSVFSALCSWCSLYYKSYFGKAEKEQ
jgi:1-acyl-sn-glycerol-3-phosphate acyltransferase